jgi:hypothetical protein
MKTCTLLSAVLLFFSIIPARGQDVTGIWRGHFNQVMYQRDAEGNKIAIPLDRYKFEIQLDQRNKAFSGVTYSYLTTVFYGKATATGTVNPSTKKVLLEELKIVEVRMSGFSDACIMTCFLQYSKNGDEEFLEGTYTSMNTRDSSNCGKGTVFLRKVVTSDFYKEPFLVEREKNNTPKKPDSNEEKAIVKNTNPKTNSTTNKTTTKPKTSPPITSTNKPKTTTANSTVKKPPVNTVAKKTTTPKKTDTTTKAPPKESITKIGIDTIQKTDKRPNLAITPKVITPKVLTTRTNELVKTISTDAGEIEIKIYDNGTIDNDTVSVYLDKKLVISKQRLTEKAITFKFKLDETNNFHELVMVAENLGEIPPNTSLMVVNAGNKQYEVRITSNEQKNAVVIFKFEKE